jgi:hypothetical protein
MDIQEFRENVIENAKMGLSSGKFSRSEFVQNIMDALVDWGELADFTPCYYEGVIGPKKKKVEFDGYDYDEDFGNLTIVTCRYDGESGTRDRLTQTDINELAERARRFIEGSLDGTVTNDIDESEQAYEFAETISNNRGNIQKFQIIILSDLEKSDRIKSLFQEKIDSKNVEVILWDIGNLYDREVSKEGFTDIEINLKDYGNDGLPCLRAYSGESNGGYDSYLCAIPGRVLADLYGKYTSRLLESNVRSFLKNTTKTNKAIRGTILREPEMFFAYNNGITVTATGIKLNSEGNRIESITAMQIVNGGQTTVSIYNASVSKEHPDISRIYVPMKISVISKEDAETIVPKISRSANTQNKVSESDFFSNSPFHRCMEACSRTEFAPQKNGLPYRTKWYYERTRGQYSQDIASKRTKAEADRFKRMFPKSQVFTKTDLAKYRNSYRQLPHIVSKGAQYSLIEFAKTVNNEDTSEYNVQYFRDTVALAIMFRRIQDMVSQQPWYNSGYRAQIVTYSMAKLFNMAESLGGSVDLSKIWEDQELSPELEEQLIGVMAAVNSAIINGKEEENIGQWCKKPKCWEKVKAAKVEVNDKFTRALISKSKQNFIRRTARRDQKNTNLMNARIQAVNLGPGFWQKVYDWGTENNTLSSDEKGIIMAHIDMNRKPPSERQSRAAMGILERLREEGFSD